MSKHTTGELRWLVVNPEGKAVAVLDSQSEAYWFTRNRGHAETAIYFNEGLDYGAAPDLLAALQLFVAQYEGGPERELRPEMVAARAAIAKAGGAL